MVSILKLGLVLWEVVSLRIPNFAKRKSAWLFSVAVFSNFVLLSVFADCFIAIFLTLYHLQFSLTHLPSQVSDCPICYFNFTLVVPL